MDDVIGQRAWNKLAAGRQCTATSKQTGERCKRAPIVGGFVCDIHGGKIPAVRKSARERLLAMVDPARDALLRALRTGPPCEHCGRSDADRDPVVLRAAQLVLDRAGYGPRATMEIIGADNAYADRTNHQLIAKLETMLDAAQALRERERFDADAVDVIDAGFEVPDDSVVPAPIHNGDVQIPDGTSTPGERNDGNH